MAAADDYRPLIPNPPGAKIAGPNARAHTQVRMKNPRAHELFDNWKRLYEEPFFGMTADGRLIPDLYALGPGGAPTGAMVDAANALLALLSPEQKKAACFSSDAKEWRRWQNTEMYVETDGIRLEEVDQTVRDAALAVMRASMSAKGYEQSLAAMRLNRFLGEIVSGPAVMNEYSFTFSLFGQPSLSEPWGWQCFGHHLCLNCFVVGSQMVLSPAFWGAEPCYADHGPYAGTRIFQDEERQGLAFMRTLSTDQQKRAIVAHSMMGGDLPPGRRHFADNLNLGGAFQDNRVVPYEGLAASDMSEEQRRDLLKLIQLFHAPLPDGALKARLTEIAGHLDATYFCWIGGTGDDDAFYYRIQSPVLFVEFDHHAGVFLTNPEPAKFHVHVILRTPNGNDYGFELLRQYNSGNVLPAVKRGS